jgi:hypothetical protein
MSLKRNPPEQSVAEADRAQAGNSANGSIPLSEWLTLMLAEIDRKRAEASISKDEQKRREDGGRRC